MYYRYNQNDMSLDTSTQTKKEMEYIGEQDFYRTMRFFDINGYSIPFRIKIILGTSDEVKIGASLIKRAAAYSCCGRDYNVDKGASLLKIVKYDKRTFWDIIYNEKKKVKVKVSLSLAK